MPSACDLPTSRRASACPYPHCSPGTACQSLLRPHLAAPCLPSRCAGLSPLAKPLPTAAPPSAYTRPSHLRAVTEPLSSHQHLLRASATMPALHPLLSPLCALASSLSLLLALGGPRPATLEGGWAVGGVRLPAGPSTPSTTACERDTVRSALRPALAQLFSFHSCRLHRMAEDTVGLSPPPLSAGGAPHASTPRQFAASHSLLPRHALLVGSLAHPTTPRRLRSQTVRRGGRSEAV